MNFMNRHHRPISIGVLISLLVSVWAQPASGSYNPTLGRWLQPDPHGTGLIVAPGLRYHGAGPVVTVSAAYQLQFADGMNFYQFVRGNPISHHDPNGLFSLADLGISRGIQGDMTSSYMDIGVSTVDAMKGIALFASDRNAQIDQLLGDDDTNPLGWDGLDNLVHGYQQYQDAMLTMFVGGLGSRAASGAISMGKRAFSHLVERAGSRHALIQTIHNAQGGLSRFFGFRGTAGSFRGSIAGEKYLGQLVGGHAQVRVALANGRTRILDRISGSIAHESKVGFARYDQRNIDQVMKDVEIVRNKLEGVKGSHWHFFRSEITGQIGADPRLLDLLTSNRIRYTIHY